jgi:pimeloyl-ACP methyl ester carboxylesterase
MGGYVALAAVARAPERVTRLALVSTSARADTPEQRAARIEGIAAAETDYERVAARLASLMVHRSRRTEADLGAVMLAMLGRVGRDEYLRQQHAALERPDARAGLAHIVAPTLVLVGSDDAIIDPARSAELAAAIPGAVTVVVPECGHVPTLERPEEARLAVERWLARS